jgi:hypothetical protein
MFAARLALISPRKALLLEPASGRILPLGLTRKPQPGPPAYRHLVDLSENLGLEGRTQPLSDDEIAAVEKTLRSVEQAIFALRQADK